MTARVYGSSEGNGPLDTHSQIPVSRTCSADISTRILEIHDRRLTSPRHLEIPQLCLGDNVLMVSDPKFFNQISP